MTNSLIFNIESLSHEGRGIAHYHDEHHPIEKHGKKIFIRYALPNETVEVRLTNELKRWEEGDMVRIIGEKSPHRVEPFCRYYMQCGGCNLQHLDLNAQIEHKQQVLASHFQHLAQVQPDEWLKPIRSQQQDYRRRTRIGVRYLAKKQQFLFGFRANQSNHLVDIEQCPILNYQLNQSLQALKQCLSQLHGKADIGHIELAMGDDDIAQNIGLLIRETASLSKKDKQILINFCQQQQWKLYLQPARRDDIYRIDDGSNAKNTADLIYKINGIQFNFAMSDFTQVNHSVNQQMIQQALALLNLQQGERVLDLFCGLGNFSLPIAEKVGKTGFVVGVEGSREMVHRASKNAQQNQLDNTDFYVQDLSKDCSKQSWAKQGFDAILIDPPRTGAWEIMAYLANFQAKRIVYVSCNPATLARDSQVLLQNGYRLSKAGIMDMFSHTAHVESMALFEQVDDVKGD